MDRRRFIIGVTAAGSLGLGTWLLLRNDRTSPAGMGHGEMGHGTGPAASGTPAQAGLKVAPEVPLLPETTLPAGKAHIALRRLNNTTTQAGVFKADLLAAAHEIEFVTGKKTTFWLYNGQVPGPVIDVFEGDQVEIRFINRLAQASTIHWHGLPVPSDQDGNPQDAVPAGGERIYRFTLPKGSAGTYWYHPHPHGDTPEQVYRGLAGLFIVRAKDDPLAVFSEQHLVISDLRLDADAQIPDNTAFDWMNGREGQFVLVNGQREPKVTIAGRQRLRIWNACNARYLRLAIPGQSFTLVGTDGGLIENPQVLAEILLVPGQRIEVIVGNGKTEQAQLKALIYNREKMGPAPKEEKRTLAQFAFTRGTVPAIPSTLRTITDFGQEVAVKKVEFSEIMRMEGGQHSMSFFVNGKSYDMQRIDLTSKAGEVEIWEIFNNSHMDHPFHLHGTQFIVLDSSLGGKQTPAPYRALHDTVNLRPNETLRIKTVQHAKGLRMFHCHILEHEGQGMMGQLKVI